MNAFDKWIAPYIENAKASRERRIGISDLANELGLHGESDRERYERIKARHELIYDRETGIPRQGEI